MNKLTKIKEFLVELVMVSIFSWSSKSRQEKILCKHAGMFLAYNNLAQKYDAQGDSMTSNNISGKAFCHLGWFTVYCAKMNVDEAKLLKAYLPRG